MLVSATLRASDVPPQHRHFDTSMAVVSRLQKCGGPWITKVKLGHWFFAFALIGAPLHFQPVRMAHAAGNTSTLARLAFRLQNQLMYFRIRFFPRQIEFGDGDG